MVMGASFATQARPAQALKELDRVSGVSGPVIVPMADVEVLVRDGWLVRIFVVVCLVQTKRSVEIGLDVHFEHVRGLGQGPSGLCVFCTS